MPSPPRAPRSPRRPRRRRASRSGRCAPRATRRRVTGNGTPGAPFCAAAQTARASSSPPAPPRGKVVTDDGVARTRRQRDLATTRDLGWFVCWERVDRNDGRDAVSRARSRRAATRFAQPRRRRPGLPWQCRVERLAGHHVAHATVHLERADRRDDDRSGWPDARQPALDVDELLEAHVRAKAGLGHDRVDQLERDAIGDDR